MLTLYKDYKIEYVNVVNRWWLKLWLVKGMEDVAAGDSGRHNSPSSLSPVSNTVVER